MSSSTGSVEEMVVMADRFVGSDLAVRLTPEVETGRARPAQWSTAAHRAVEDRTLALMGTLASRPSAAVAASATEAALDAAPDLGEDQVAAVRVLAGEGGSLRAVLAPAGYGKTTMLHTAARAAAADGRPVVAVATTAKAVAELAGAGLDAKTVARLRIELSNGPLAAGTVVVLDEISQTPTDQVEAVLAAVDACPGGSLWVLGDPRQSQPVGPGGAAAHIEALASAGAIASARLVVNRRQVDPADREALGLLRRGEPTASQQLRSEQGWEHEHASPAQARQAMAEAVCADIAKYGADQVAALVVSHTDAEDLADRVRAHLSETGVLSGPAVAGPGWASEREYRAGDRVLLHARCGAPTSRLVNGTTATVARAGTDGLTVRLDNDKRAEVLLPAAFVAGARKDGAPNLSHAWARTVDGAQGGTWEACHLLGSSALDAYRGYTGQSRSRRPTHTWNTARVVADHGGALADQRDGATQVADALGRQPDPSMAARSDPWVVDRQLRELMADHERALSARPPDRQDALAAATDEMGSASAWLENMDAVAAHSARQLDQLGRLAGLSRHGRDQRRLLHDRLEAERERAAAARERYEGTAERVERLRQDQDAYERFETAEGGRRGDLVSLGHQLDRHWAAVVVACVVADDPLAYGIGQLRHARSTLEYDRWAIDAAEGRAQQWTKAERDLLERLAVLTEHQDHIADLVAQRQELGTTLAQVDAALDRTRPARVAALAEDPPGHLVQRIGPAPGTPAGRAVWCHHAHDIEADLDRNDGAIPPWTGWSPQTDLARRQIAIADCVLQASNDRPGPTEWAELAQQAGAGSDQAPLHPLCRVWRYVPT
jgi:hypothetical protein